MHFEEDLKDKTMKTALKKLKKENAIANSSTAMPFELAGDAIVFNGKMRKMLVEGVLQDIKGFIKSKTNGLVEVVYEDYQLGSYEFGFKLYASKSSKCTMQMFYEATAAIVSAVNYMFQGNDEQYDVIVLSDLGKLEVEFISKW